MQSVFLEDICSEIFSSLSSLSSGQQVLGRISLTCKGGRQQTWSLASTIDITQRIDWPFDNIFQFTGSRLTAVRLSHPEQFPATIRHLVDHCPRVRHLVIERDIIVTFTLFRELVAQLIQGVQSLTISVRSLSQRHYCPESEDRLNDLTISELENIVLFCNGPIHVRSLSTNWSIGRILSPNSGPLSRILKHFTALENVNIPISPRYGDHLLGSLFGSSTMLKRIDSVLAPSRDWPSWFQELSRTQVGWNIYFGEPMRPQMPLFLRVMSSLHPDDYSGSMAALRGTPGIPRVDAAQFAFAAKHLFGTGLWKMFLAAWTSGALANVLPPLQEVSRHINQREWRSLFADNDAQTIQKTFEMFGVVPKEILRPVDVLIVCIGSTVFREDNVRLMAQLGVVDLSLLESYFPRGTSENLFFLAHDANAIKFVLSHTSREYALAELRSKSGSQVSPIILLLDPRRRPSLSVILDEFDNDDGVLLSFPESSDFFSAAESLLSGQTAEGDLDLLRRMTAATGAGNIDAELRGKLLWMLCENATRSNRSPEFNFWVDFILSDRSIEPIVVCENTGHAIRCWKDRIDYLLPILIRLRDLIVKQAQTSKWTESVFEAFGYLVLHVCRSAVVSVENPSKTFSDLFQHFFAPLARVLACEGRSVCSALPNLYIQTHPDMIAYQLVCKFCIGLEFAEDNSEFHAKGSQGVLSALYYISWPPGDSSLLDIIDVWWDVVRPEHWGEPSLMVATVVESLLRLQTKKLFRLQSVIEGLVLRGARLSSDRKLDCDTQALEIYYEAVRNAQR